MNSTESSEKDTVSSDESSIPNVTEDTDENNKKDDKSSSDDIYEFKEPEPFEFESRAKMTDDKSVKKRLVPRIFEEVEKSPRRRNVKSPSKSESPALEKRSKRTPPVKKAEDSEEDEKKSEDPFDKLVESPSFRILKSSEKVGGHRGFFGGCSGILLCVLIFCGVYSVWFEGFLLTAVEICRIIFK